MSHDIRLDTLDPEEADIYIANIEAQYQAAIENGFTTENISLFFEHIKGLVYNREFVQAVEDLHVLREHLDNLIENDAENSLLFEKLIEWNNVALRFIAPEPDVFHELAHYLEIIDVCESKNGIFELKSYQAKIGLINHFNNWKENGGNINVIEHDDLAFLHEISETIEVDTLAKIQEYDSMQDFKRLIPLERTLAQYYLQNNKPTESIQLLKNCIEHLPNHPDYAETDIADVQMEIGGIFFQYKKFKTAKSYFELARNIYAESGEKYEFFEHQCSGWIEDCDSFL